MRLTIVIKKGESGYLVGQLKELPAVFTQGTTVKELKSNILEALELYFEDLREQYESNGDMIAEEELHLV
jgi:predicted RNase H-like HicB family nuclease